MALDPTTLRRLTWKIVPADTRKTLKSAWATIAGAILRRRPRVEMFGGSSAQEIHNQLRLQLESVNIIARTPLCRIMTSYGSDKGTGRHNYTRLYHSLFSPLKSSEVRLFELGIGTNNPNLVSTMGTRGKPGASLRGWAEFFPFGEIVGADIDRDILFNEGRIKTFYCDQLSPTAIESLWAHPPLRGEFDVIIEDGLHTFEANVSFMDNSLHKVRRGGYYIIEDVSQADLPRWRAQLQNHYSTNHPDFSFSLVGLPWTFNNSDNNLVVVRRH